MNHPGNPLAPKGVLKRSPTNRVAHFGKLKHQLHDETPRFGLCLDECPSSYESESVIPDSATSTKRDQMGIGISNSCNKNTQPKLIMSNLMKPPKPPRESTINPRNIS